MINITIKIDRFLDLLDILNKIQKSFDVIVNKKKPSWQTLAIAGLVSERTAFSPEYNMNVDFLTFKVTLLVSPSSDVVERSLKVTQTFQGQTSDQSIPLTNDQTEATFEVIQDAHVLAEEFLKDDAGNSSLGEALEFDARDTMAPVVGGRLTISGPTAERSGEIPDPAGPADTGTGGGGTDTVSGGTGTDTVGGG